MRNKNSWIFVFLVVAITVATSVASLDSQGQDKSCMLNQEQKDLSEQERRWKEFESQLPVVDYDAPEIADFKERNERILKNNRYDNRGILSVFSSLPEDGEGLLHSFDSLPYARIPVVESEIVIVGEILDTQAYLSNNKKGVYSEFTLRVDEVLKNSLNKINGSQITFDRQGGVVRYKNGKTRVYKIRPYGMPKIGNRYVLFLKNTEKSPNYEILTGYELKANHTVINLDDFPQFEEYAGSDEKSFIKTIRETVAQSSQPAPNQ
jgi:hypothetical protein